MSTLRPDKACSLAHGAREHPESSGKACSPVSMGACGEGSRAWPCLGPTSPRDGRTEELQEPMALMSWAPP